MEESNKMTDIQVVRKTRSKSNQQQPEEIAKYFCAIGQDPPGFEKFFMNDVIGVGIFSTKQIQAGEFVLEYAGDFISLKEGEQREQNYPEHYGSFLFFYNKHCIDATFHPTRLGRLVNDSPYPNCTLKVIANGDKFHLCMFANKDIEQGREIRYSYGVKHLEWRKNKLYRYPSMKNDWLKEAKKIEKSSKVLKASEIIQSLNTSFNEEKAVDKVPLVKRKETEEEIETKTKKFKQDKADEKVERKIEQKETEKVTSEGSGEDKNKSTSAQEETDFECVERKTADLWVVEEIPRGRIEENRFQISSRIGEGQFADVYIGRVSNRDVAVRKLKLCFAQGISRKRFSRIAEKLMELKHSYIVETFAYTLEKSLIQELCGIEVSDMGEKVVVRNLQSALSILEEDFLLSNKYTAMNHISSALHYLHTKEMVAGDLKPSNVLIKCEGEKWIFKLSDINVEREIAEQTFQSVSTSSKAMTDAVFTLSYLAPELISSDISFSSVNQTSLSDIYAFGVMSFQMFFPKEPIKVGQNAVQHLDAVKNRKWRPIIPQHAINDDVFINVMGLVDKCLQWSPDERPSAQQIHEKLMSLLDQSTHHEHKLNDKDAVQSMDKKVDYENINEVPPSPQDNIDNSLLRDESIRNDSGLFGDFPEIIMTDQDNGESASDASVGLEDVSDDNDVDYRPLSSDTSVSEEESDGSVIDSVADNKKQIDSNPDKTIDGAKGKTGSSPNDEKHTDGEQTEAFEFSCSEEEDENHNDDEVFVPDTKKTCEGYRIYNRKHACFFCGIMSPKISRHLLDSHKDEKAVKEIVALDKKEKKLERKDKFKQLRLKGDFFNNIKTLKTGGELIVLRRPSYGIKVPASEFLPCKVCYGFVHAPQLRRHTKKCLKTTDLGDDEENGGIVRQSELLLYPNKVDVIGSVELQEFVLRGMNKDEITGVVKSDELLQTYGSFLLSGKGVKRPHDISQSMRIMARLLISLRKETSLPGADLISFMKPTYFDKIIKCTREMGGYSSKNSDGELIPTFGTPSLPLKIGYSLDNILMILHGMGIRKNNDSYVENSKKLQKLYKQEWPVLISSASLRTLADNKFNKTEVMPVTSDLLKVKEYNTKQIAIVSSDLMKCATVEKWRELCELVVTRLTILNKRRGNEVSSLLLKRFVERGDHSKIIHDDILESLTPLERKLVNRLDLVHVRGKRGRQVPILLTKEAVDAMNFLLQTREKVGVHSNNKYFFAAPTRGSLNPLRGYQCVSDVTNRVDGLERPDLIKSTKLRKYLATVAQIVDLEKNEVEWLANHLGHSTDVHKEYYRLQESTVELAKVSRLLMAVDSGKGKDLCGKKLAEINLNDIPSVEDDVEEGEEEREGVENTEQNNVDVNETRKLIANLGNGRKGIRKWNPWSANESKIVLEAFHQHIVSKTLPGKRECQELIDKNHQLRNRSWSNIKDFVRQHKIRINKKK